MEINCSKLAMELMTAGLPTVGVTSNGYVHWLEPPTKEQKALAEQIIKAHDPASYILTPGQQLIIANGAHEALVTVGVGGVDPLPMTDKVTVNGSVQAIDLVNGLAELKFSSTIPGTVIKIEFHGLYAVVEAK